MHDSYVLEIEMIIKEFDMGTAHVEVFDSRNAMGEKAGKDIGALFRTLLKKNNELNVMFAAAPSQNEVLSQLLREQEIDWTKINAFHMDEYIGIAPDNPAGFAQFLKAAIFGRLPFKSVNYIDCTAADPYAEANRYAELLKNNPLDVCILGVGENGHIAFNDPDVADFCDPVLAKVIDLDETSRQQQVNDGCFHSIGDVPHKAITVTIPGLTKAKYLFCSVPGTTKAKAISRMFNGSISLECPATILRQTENSRVYLDKESARGLL